MRSGKNQDHLVSGLRYSHLSKFGNSVSDFKLDIRIGIGSSCFGNNPTKKECLKTLQDQNSAFSMDSSKCLVIVYELKSKSVLFTLRVIIIKHKILTKL